MDFKTAVRVAHMEGVMEGEIKMIHLCERFLKRPETAAATLAKLPFEEVSRMARELEEELLPRPNNSPDCPLRN